MTCARAEARHIDESGAYICLSPSEPQTLETAGDLQTQCCA